MRATPRRRCRSRSTRPTPTTLSVLRQAASAACSSDRARLRAHHRDEPAGGQRLVPSPLWQSQPEGSLLAQWSPHLNNFVVELDGTTPRIRVIDFSEAPALIEASARQNLIPMSCATITIGRLLRTKYPFSTLAADLTLDRIGAVGEAKMTGILAEMPADWLPANVRTEFLSWWLSSERQDRISVIRTGLFNGTLL